MEKSFFKVFFSKIKEREWLNKMGDEGYLLLKINDSKYYFTHSEEHKYNYSIEYLEVSPHSDEANAYFEQREQLGITPAIVNGCWIYFVKEDGVIEITDEVYKKNSNFYFWKTLYLFFFAITGAIVCGYQAFAARFILRLGHTGDGVLDLLAIDKSAVSFGAKFLNILKEWWNNVLELLNNYYLKIFRNLYGESDAIFVLGVLVPVVIILTVLFAMYLNEYVEYRLLCKKSKVLVDELQSEGEENAEQTV